MSLVEWPQEVNISRIFSDLINIFMKCFDGWDNLIYDAQDNAIAYGCALYHLYCESFAYDIKCTYTFSCPREISLTMKQKEFHYKLIIPQLHDFIH